MVHDAVPEPGPDTVIVLADDCRQVVIGRVADVEPIVVFEAVARLHLMAARRGLSVRARSSDPVLIALFDLVGMSHLVEQG